MHRPTPARRPSLAAHAAAVAALVTLAPSLGCPSDPAFTAGPIELEVTGLPAAPVAGGTLLDAIVIHARSADGRLLAGLALTVEVTAGGGLVRAADGRNAPTARLSLTTDAEGEAHLDWQLGVLPIENALALDAGPAGSHALHVDVAAGGAASPVAFGALDAFLASRGIEGSTEDLAFSPDGGLVLGVPGGLVALDPSGTARMLETTGEPLEKPLGLAYDSLGRLWMADVDAEAVVRLEADRRVVRVVDGFMGTRFAGPNDVAVGPDDHVYVSDPCMGAVFAFDPDGAPLGRVDFGATRGGPNGVVVGPDGAVWVTTENTGIFCMRDGVGITEPVGGLYRVPVLADGSLGAYAPIAENLATFGDGLVFDGEGNLYALFDTTTESALDESIVFVLPRGETTLRRAFAARDRVWANLAFGPDAFGTSTLYLALLAVPFFTPPEARGVERIEVGVRGLD